MTIFEITADLTSANGRIDRDAAVAAVQTLIQDETHVDEWINTKATGHRGTTTITITVEWDNRRAFGPAPARNAAKALSRATTARVPGTVGAVHARYLTAGRVRNHIDWQGNYTPNPEPHADNAI